MNKSSIADKKNFIKLLLKFQYGESQYPANPFFNAPVALNELILTIQIKNQ